MAAWHDQRLERPHSPERHERQELVVGADDALAARHFQGGIRAQQAGIVAAQVRFLAGAFPQHLVRHARALPTEHEVTPAQLQLPWSAGLRYAVGTFARERGAELPQRLVSSAKSWLCNPAIDRTAQVLPFRGAQRSSTRRWPVASAYRR